MPLTHTPASQRHHFAFLHFKLNITPSLFSLPQPTRGGNGEAVPRSLPPNSLLLPNPPRPKHTYTHSSSPPSQALEVVGGAETRDAPLSEPQLPESHSLRLKHWSRKGEASLKMAGRSSDGER